MAGSIKHEVVQSCIARLQVLQRTALQRRVPIKVVPLQVLAIKGSEVFRGNLKTEIGCGVSRARA